MKEPRTLRAARGFTLIELLIVIAIITILAGILLPALQRARLRAAVTTCSSNQRQTYLLLNLYASDWTEYPSGVSPRMKQYYNNCPDPATGTSVARVTGDEGGGQWTMRDKLLALNYARDKRIITCTAPPMRGSGWKWSHRYADGWYDYNGPHVNGQAVGTYGHTNSMRNLGHHVTNNSWCLASWGVDIKFLNYRNARSGIKWSSDQTAFLGCPAIMYEAGSTIVMYEPHLDMPITAIGGNHQGSDQGPDVKYRRNYTAAAGNVVFLNYNRRFDMKWWPK